MTSETQNPVEAVARAICLVHGQDPDEFAPLTEICSAENQPELWWRFYEEDAHAALSAISALPQALGVGRDELVAAYIAGAAAVHENYQEDRDPEFGEAAYDYVASLALTSQASEGGGSGQWRPNREAIARLIDPSSWRVMDGYLENMKRKYAGQDAAYDPDAFKDKKSLAQADQIVALLSRPPPEPSSLSGRVAELEGALRRTIEVATNGPAGFNLEGRLSHCGNIAQAALLPAPPAPGGER